MKENSSAVKTLSTTTQTNQSEALTQDQLAVLEWLVRNDDKSLHFVNASRFDERRVPAVDVEFDEEMMRIRRVALVITNPEVVKELTAEQLVALYEMLRWVHVRNQDITELPSEFVVNSTNLEFILETPALERLEVFRVRKLHLVNCFALREISSLNNFNNLIKSPSEKASILNLKVTHAAEEVPPADWLKAKLGSEDYLSVWLENLKQVLESASRNNIWNYSSLHFDKLPVGDYLKFDFSGDVSFSFTEEVTQVGADFFDHCQGLAYIGVNGENLQKVSYDFKSLTNLKGLSISSPALVELDVDFDFDNLVGLSLNNLRIARADLGLSRLVRQEKRLARRRLFKEADEADNKVNNLNISSPAKYLALLSHLKFPKDLALNLRIRRSNTLSAGTEIPENLSHLVELETGFCGEKLDLTNLHQLKKLDLTFYGMYNDRPSYYRDEYQDPTEANSDASQAKVIKPLVELAPNLQSLEIDYFEHEDVEMQFNLASLKDLQKVKFIEKIKYSTELEKQRPDVEITYGWGDEEDRSLRFRLAQRAFRQK